MARPERLELPTTAFEARYSIQLSYGRVGGRFQAARGGSQPLRRGRNQFEGKDLDLAAAVLEVVWWRLLLRRARKVPAKELDYGMAAGSEALREAIAVHLRRSRGVGVYGVAGYYLGRARRPGLMLGYSRLNARDIEEGVRRLAEVV